MAGLPVPKATAPPKIKTISVKNWQQGIVTALDDGRTPIKGLRSGGNIMLDQDETVRPRYSLALYGPQPTGTVLGEVFEFRARVNLTFTNYLICMQNVSGTTNIYVAKGEDTSWTKCSASTTFDNSAKAHFTQLNDKVIICNGTDTLGYLDTSTLTVTKFTSMTNATTPTIANNGSSDLTTGTTSFTVYYAVTANSSVGETAAVANASKAINTDRDFWNASTQSLKVTWSAVTNAKSYNLYMGIADSGAGSPTLYRIASGLSADSTTFVDDGTAAQQLINVAPQFNSTSGPKATRPNVVNGRLFLVGDFNNPYYVWYGGDPGFELDFSPSNGGGYAQVGNGTKELPICVKPFHQGKGDPGIFVLTQGTNGAGKRYVMSSDSVTYNNTTITFYDVQEDNGTDGTDSPDGVIIYNDALYYPSTNSFKTTATKAQLQNILSTDSVSDAIQKDVVSLQPSAMNGCVGLAYEGRLYWAVPYASSTNNEIWVLDVERGGAWMKPWNVPCDWMLLYSDNSTGKTHFLVLQNNQIFEFTDSQFTNDNGTSFTTSLDSGQISFSDDGRTWARLLYVIYVLLRPQGTFQASVSGEGTNGAIGLVGSNTFTPKTSVAGWDEPLYAWDDPRRAWDAVMTVPQTFNSATQEIKVKVDKDVKWFSYGLITTDYGTSFWLSDVVAEYVEIGNRDV